MNDAVLGIDASVASKEFERAGASFDEKIKAAWTTVVSESLDYQASANNGDNEYVLRAGIGAALLAYKDDPEMSRRVKHEVRLLRQFSALLSAAQVGLASGIEGFGSTEDGAPAPEPLGIMGLFREWVSERRKLADPNWRRAERLARELGEHCRTHKIVGTFGNVEVKP